ncbi:uncharacterized protein [Medicago truncatula]|uniref:uncharacterized protein n=1 Tax=Medicago truncatula TaxID=3880 RepID=UPI001967EA9D|nr:uncharacterized protein LOC120575887 [Medicago truncatula]
MWDMTHKRVDGKYVNEEAQKIGEKICNHIAENPDAYSEISPNDIVGKIFGKEHSGRVRGMGMRVVPTIAFKHTTTQLSGMEFGSFRGSTSSGSSALVNQKLATMEAQMTALVGYIKAKEGGSLPPELAAALFPNDTQQVSNVGSESPTSNDITRSSDESNARGA